MDSSVAVSLTSMVTMQGVQMFSSHAPSIRELRKAHRIKDVDKVAELRVAEVEAASVMVLSGVAVSAMTGSPAPAYLAIATVVIMIGVYEWTLAQPPVSSITTETVSIAPPSMEHR